MNVSDKQLVASQLRGWVQDIREGRTEGVLAGMEAVAQDLDPSATFDRKIVFTRMWDDDWGYVCAHVSASQDYPLNAWWRQVWSELAEAADGKEGIFSFTTNLEDACMVLGGTAKFTVRVCFYYDLDESFACDADLIQKIFYDQGGVAGDFTWDPADTNTNEED